MGKYELINGLPQILNILHQVNRPIREPFRDLAMRKDADELKNCFIFPFANKKISKQAMSNGQRWKLTGKIDLLLRRSVHGIVHIQRYLVLFDSLVHMTFPLHRGRDQAGGNHPCSRPTSAHLAIEDKIASLRKPRLHSVQ